jgi:glyoxylase-like metal-dependent hydrolase (beta-lactamase superfamily II)
MTMLTALAPDLLLIDTGYQGTPQAIGVYLLLGERPALIETGPTTCLERVLDGVRAAGLSPEALRAVAVTHIHLDHAGAAGVLARRLPHLEVYVHPVGAPHLRDPSRLLASARRLYGETLEPLFGEVAPVPADRVHVLEEGAQVRLGSRTITALDTPGHARHHLAYWDPHSGDLFTGDVGGVAIPGLRYVRAPTPPPDFDPLAWHASLARLRALRPRRLLLTHFGAHDWVDELLDELDAAIDRFVELGREVLASGADAEVLAERLRAEARTRLAERGGAAALAHLEIVMPSVQSALGVIRYLTRQAAG